MSRRPPASIATSILFAPASSAFSINSFTAAAGRSITSPAAMRSTSKGSRRRIGMERKRPRELYRIGERAGKALASGDAEVAVKMSAPRRIRDDARGRMLLSQGSLCGGGRTAAQGAMPLPRMPVHQRRGAEHVHADAARGVPLPERGAEELHARRSRSAGDARDFARTAAPISRRAGQTCPS